MFLGKDEEDGKDVSSLCVSRDVSNAFIVTRYLDEFALREQGCFQRQEPKEEPGLVRSA